MKPSEAAGRNLKTSTVSRTTEMGKISLSHKILLAFVIMLVPVLSVFFLSYKHTKRNVERIVLQDLKLIAEAKEGDILFFLEMNKRRVADFASDGFIRDELERLIKGGRKDGHALGDYILKNKLVLDRNIFRINVSSRDGRAVASTADDRDGADVSREEYFLKGRDALAVVERDRGYGGRPELAFSTPVYSRKGGSPIGVLTGFVSVSKFLMILTGEQNMAIGDHDMDAAKEREPMEIYLVNGNRRMLANPRFIENAILNQKVDTMPVEACLSSKTETTGFYRDYRGVEVAGAAACIPSLGWTLLVEIDKDEAFLPVAGMQEYLLAAFAAVVIFIIGFFVYISRAVVSPLRGLSLAAKAIEGGDYDISVPAVSNDEIGSLAGSFNKMARGIRERTLALKDSEERMQAILDNTTSVVFMKDRDGRYKFVNRSFERLFNVSRGDMPGKSDYDIFPKDVADSLMANDRLALESGRPIEFEEHIAVGGESRFYISVKFALVDAGNRPYAVCGVSTDVTELKRSHDALKKSEASLANAQRIAHIGNCELDAVTGALYCSGEIYNILGVGRDAFDATFQAFLKHVHPADREFVKDSVNAAFLRATPYSIDHRIVRADGEVRIVHAQGEVIIERGKAVMMSGTMQDITERKTAEDELRLLNAELEKRVIERTGEFQNANRELEAFSYSVAHDLRSPLRVIDGFSGALLEDYGDRLDEHGHDYLRRVREASQRMGILIDDLLNLSRVMRVDIRSEPVDLSAMAVAVASELKKAKPGRAVEFVIAQGLKAAADARLIRIVMDNLIGNAWKFTSKKDAARVEFGTLGLPGAAEGGKAVYFVRDNGAGFNMKYVDRLFGAFQRLHAVNEFSGTGIGLATVQRIIHRHGGKVWAEGAEGEGATFYFTL